MFLHLLFVYLKKKPYLCSHYEKFDNYSFANTLLCGLR